MTGETDLVDKPPHNNDDQNVRRCQFKPRKRAICCKNHQDKNKDVYDTLYDTGISENTTCTNQVCLGSMMAQPGRNDIRTPQEILQHAKDFLDQYFTSIRRSQSPAHIARWEQVQKEVNTTGAYQLTETELIYGAKLAWRNSVRCIGRIQWSKLQVFDCRYVTTTSGMFEALCNHIKYSTNKGNIRSAITIFPQRTDGKHDFRVWNQQLLGYAGYRQPDGSVVGDPLNVEFTEMCQKLGWKSAGTRWDLLPLVLSANGHDPDYFDIPSEYVLEVPLSHPTLDWFEELGLKWYALPAVSSMMFDCGGIQFTAAPFNGWYMSTEIGCRNLCDTHRLNMLETVALKMGLDTRTPVTLWKDKALVECNVAVLHSFQQKGVTIVDHHTASESFMKHLENEVRLRHGCPADWVWIVPPLSGSATPVFHQEMALYYLKPSYEYQEPAWKSHVWKKGRDSGKSKKPRRKFHFKQIARAVKFTSKLFGRALSRRIKATVLYATETGKSEGYAKKLGEIFGHAFNAQVYSMADYDISSIEHEALLLVVTSTFGNGDPPENGEEFAKNLYTLKMNENGISNGDPTKLRFAVFGLGSSAYPNFCAFGKYVDNLLGELGGERLLKLATGDEMCGQEQAFRKWAPQIFKVACETFCLDDDDTFLEATITLQSQSLTAQTVRFVEAKVDKLTSGLQKCHNKKVSALPLIRRTNLHGENSPKATLLLEFDNYLLYKPGDHVGVFAVNRPEIVDKIITRLKGVTDPDAPVELQIQSESHTSNGVVKTWTAHERLPRSSVRELLSRYLDITTPPSPNLLEQFAAIATDEEDQRKLNTLATDSAAYEDWRHWRFPNLLEVLEEFPSIAPYAPLLLAQLSILQPRFYSISSSPALNPNQLHLTVAVVVYRTQDGEGPIHHGVCSNYLQDIPEGEEVCLFVRSAPSFYLPNDISRPVILVGPGTGIAPFRSFWQHRYALMKQNQQKVGKMWLFFGCRTKDMDLYKEEKVQMQNAGVLDRVFLALSREPNIPKTYVQNLAQNEAAEIYRFLVIEKGHFYVCGDCTMAEHVYQTLKSIIQKYGGMTDQQVQNYMLSLRDENRYHEDIFGITLRTAEVHNRSRESARIRMASEP
ncbi:nitric oxide synthase, salivary gland isoform X1 [Aethina tumida]|uniref:nitric oxide synthase, salivary gland isoform X1 n=1 Tax=Aethina tumida TaxID=116153 RepID=UPI00096AE936|nr:nitric oxide synthase, salivary gland isoform X1 [Aethina tumida]XP_019875679.1 nitric oxide synthase, salivary gland isoform X1 [Aethina tumida]XP_049824092.1 nitric oxide synthase, salivary gland isoform X1 [Aethina tumida]XP_049824093.1 nitric oxide synthase, salivary gland isoform X1 [Aethina tumida]